MKFLISTIFTLLVTNIIIASNPQKIVDSKIKEVTVYRQQAKVSNEATLSINSGTSEIVFQNISTQINPNSLQVAVKGDITLLSARFETNYLKRIESTPQIKNLVDSIELLKDKQSWNNEMIQMYSSEESILEVNKKLNNEKINITATDVKAYADMYRIRLFEIREKKFSISKQQIKLNEAISNLQSQLNEWNSKDNEASGQIILTISSNTAISGTIKCTYIVNNAGWTPIYDLRSEGWGKPIDLIYKANVYQNTGYNWDNVNLTICTGNPTLNNNRPILNPVYINFITYRVLESLKSNGAVGYKSYEAAPATANMLIDGVTQEEKVFEQTRSLDNIATENLLNEAFKLSIPQSVESDGKVHLVNMNTYTLPATYEYHSVPKLDQVAYLLAKITDYGKYNLLPGDANIFLEGSYIGQSTISPFTMGDTMLISLGRDEGINIKRIKLLEFCKTKWVDTKKTETIAYEISIKNNKSSNIEIDVLDQVPISKSDDIKVEIEEMSGAIYTAELGKVNWKLAIPANSSKKIKLIYTIRYPKDQSVQETNY